eukprot:7683706-Pyramimonas_sp.AAC.1
MSLLSYRGCVGPFAAKNSSQQRGLLKHEARGTKPQKKTMHFHWHRLRSPCIAMHRRFALASCVDDASARRRDSGPQNMPGMLSYVGLVQVQAVLYDACVPEQFEYPAIDDWRKRRTPSDNNG